jgi:predicted amidohydrolase
METLIVAAVSVRNLVGKVDASIEDMRKWVGVVCEKGAELVLFPELHRFQRSVDHEMFKRSPKIRESS